MGTRKGNGQGCITTHGYVIYSRDGERIYEHIEVAERALGKRLPAGAEVHHVNENRSDNRPANLVICPDRAYHQLLHARQKALDACGHADWMNCCFCKQWDDPANLTIRKNQRSGHHRKCEAIYRNKRYHALKELSYG